ncbi:hypothetical protein [Paraflavitalea sp. CAU 1676]|uniref:hypothetical protein n=1 Tax=Paraflavitalea sp. CAU 1676 TaxID=3032598 RepID=UPI0023DA5555|nr:hypothetical protein [Paraflavitalea sp. CAU 1676]MDF2190186.1 hypothetical protein [Paraflavitalea sp. CAU 1676]
MEETTTKKRVRAATAGKKRATGNPAGIRRKAAVKKNASATKEKALKKVAAKQRTPGKKKATKKAADKNKAAKRAAAQQKVATKQKATRKKAAKSAARRANPTGTATAAKKKLAKKKKRPTTKQPADRKSAKRKVTKKAGRRSKSILPSADKVEVVTEAAHAEPVETVAEVVQVQPVVTEVDVFPAEAVATSITHPDWQAVAHFDNNGIQPINFCSCHLTVPQPPDKNIGQTIILFIGLQSIAEQRLLQPILQWGRSQMGGGRFWSIGSCVAKGAFGLEQSTDLQEVAPGTALKAIIALNDVSGNQFVYSCFFEDRPGTRIQTDPIPPLKNCCVTLEASLIETRQHYPPEPLITMKNIVVQRNNQMITPPWRLEGFSEHGEKARLRRVQGQLDQIDLFFQS